MLAVGSELNADAIAAGRLKLVQGEVDELPWPPASFTCAAAVNVWFFVPRPEQTLRELARVLRSGGRLVIVTVGTNPHPASTGPWAPALRTYSDSSMEAMVREAGFAAVSVAEPGPGLQSVRAVR